MYLKSLEINGFKSFANNTTLVFLPPKEGRFSVTAVVGPNGSGKSNVADAVRWVLGEQSQKNLRGKKSEDVIFAGSDGKGKMSLASVTMILDNSDKRAPVDYEELIITRRLYRSGESEYLINGNRVRLIDLQILLAQSQFGHGSYSVVGQGMIDNLLLQSPQERKTFFEEAVGIKEFQIKRHQAVLKLDRTRENILQSDRLLQEIEPHLRSLKRQVKKLEQRQEVEKELRDWQESYYVTLCSNISDKINELQLSLDSVEKEYKEKNSKLNSIQIELANLAKEESRQGAFNDLQLEYRRLVQEKNNLEREHSVVSGKMQIEFSKVGKQNVSWLENKIASLNQEKNSFHLEMNNEEKQRETQIKKIEELRIKIETLRKEKLSLENEQAELEKTLRELRAGQSEFHLEGLRAVEAILHNQNSFGGKVYGIVAQLAQVEEKFRVALEVAGQSHLSSIVVEDDHVAEACINFLKKQQLGVATFLPLNKIRPRPILQDIENLTRQNGVFGLAVSLTRFNPLFNNIFSYVFGSTLVVDNINVGREIGIGRVRMVSVDGDIIETSGSMKGGWRKKKRVGLRFSSTDYFVENRIEEYEKTLIETHSELRQLSEEENKLQQSLLEFTAEEKLANNKIDLLVGKERQLTSELSALEQELAIHFLDPKEYGFMMEKLAEEKNVINCKIIEIEKDIAKSEEKIQAFNQNEEIKRQRVFTLQDEMQECQTILNKIVENKNSCQVEIAKYQTHQEDLEQEIFEELKCGSISLFERGVPKISEDKIDQIKSEIEKAKYKLSLIGGIDEEALTEYEEIRSKYEKLNRELVDLNKALEDLEEMITELDKIMKKKHSIAFNKIKKEFERYFKLLFEGGKAELTEVYNDENSQTDEDVLENQSENSDNQEENITQSSEDSEFQKEKLSKKRRKILQGVEIFASPPGKKINNIQALSGGERSLTSIALLCAILHINPSPFVLLDEVEAALDESNTLRFTKILHELSEHSQFIVITHNRVTMHSSDALYGVTMGEDGISKLLSVNLEK